MRYERIVGYWLVTAQAGLTLERDWYRVALPLEVRLSIGPMSRGWTFNVFVLVWNFAVSFDKLADEFTVTAKGDMDDTSDENGDLFDGWRGHYQ